MILNSRQFRGWQQTRASGSSSMDIGPSVPSSDMPNSIHLCYENVNRSCVKAYIFSPAVKDIFYLIFSSMIVLTVAGNMLVIVSILHFKQLHTPTNFLILSLAAADLLLGVLVIPFAFAYNVENCWYLGHFFCKIHISLAMTLVTASIINLSFISIDRYYAVCRPLHYRTTITVQTSLIMVMVSWGVSTLVGFGTIFLELNILGEEEFYYKHVLCEGLCVFYLTATSRSICTLLSFYLPALIMLCIYLKIFLVAQRQARSIQSTTFQNQNSGAVASKSERKAFRTLAIVMGAFLCCWTPLFLCIVATPYLVHTNLPLVLAIANSIGYSNSFLNPIVYAFFYSWFRRAFRMIVFGSIFQPQSSNTNLSGINNIRLN
ncbi:trace amine-associated receptor 1-like [Hypomesus transpacificus]|uniref:trace amine-associated receptor 1-like n=1 Tax=Hypomesus transpacificus TaxID=137520 RepID=UPI001F084227|nr:trace amine-associated receptor 1-like [Hypomesus transpacificus]